MVRERGGAGTEEGKDGRGGGGWGWEGGGGPRVGVVRRGGWKGMGWGEERR